MKFQAKVFGKKIPWNDATPEMKQAWKFEKRPGGWVIATLKNPDGTVERIRFSFQQVKNQIWAKLPQSSVTNALDFYGERSSVSRSSAQQDSASDFTAQFPGKVRKILAKEGQVVDADMPLLMIEAMKMEFPIKSSEPGIVQKILVEEGQVLTPGQKLLLFEVTPKEGKK